MSRKQIQNGQVGTASGYKVEGQTVMFPRFTIRPNTAGTTQPLWKDLRKLNRDYASSAPSALHSSTNPRRGAHGNRLDMLDTRCNAEIANAALGFSGARTLEWSHEAAGASQSYLEVRFP
jgi:hypothetical protein